MELPSAKNEIVSPLNHFHVPTIALVDVTATTLKNIGTLTVTGVFVTKTLYRFVQTVELLPDNVGDHWMVCMALV